VYFSYRNIFHRFLNTSSRDFLPRKRRNISVFTKNERKEKKEMKTRANIRRSIKAVSPVISVLLMIAIAVAAALVAYAWVMGYMGATTTKVGKAILIQSQAPGASGIDLYVQNVGQSPVMLDPSGSVYINDELQSLLSGDFDKLTLNPGETAWIQTSYPWSESFKVKIVATDGTFTEKTGYYENTGTSVAYSVDFILGTGGSSMAPTQGPHSYGGTIDISATPDTDYEFEEWIATGSITFEDSHSASTKATINGEGTITATFTYSPSQVQVTFSATGLDSDAGANTVLTVGTTNYAWDSLPSGISVDIGTSYTWSDPVSVSLSEQFVLTAGSSGTVTASGTISATYQKQIKVTFDASSNVKGDSSADLVIVNTVGHTLPWTTVWLVSGVDSLNYAFQSPIASSGSPATTRYLWSTTSGLSQTLQSNTFTVGAPGTVTATYTTQTFGVDANCIGFGSIAEGTSIPITTTSMTAQANELLMIVITHGTTSGSNTRSFTLSDSFAAGDLTYTQRGSTITLDTGNGMVAISVYYARTDASHTGSFTITATPSSYSRNFDVLVFGITGAKTTGSPFDTYGTLPRTSSSTSSSTPSRSGVYTSNPTDIVLAFEGQMSSTAQTAGSPFQSMTALLRNANGLGCNVEYEIVTSTLSNVNVQFGTSVANWVMIVDAVQRGW
jgi:hypothetical protein